MKSILDTLKNPAPGTILPIGYEVQVGDVIEFSPNMEYENIWKTVEIRPQFAVVCKPNQINTTGWNQKTTYGKTIYIRWEAPTEEELKQAVLYDR